jgi:DNA-binding FadR family transcriptional regulator
MTKPSTLTGHRAPLKRRKLYEDVVETIEKAIHAGEYAPGDRLPSERDLMAHFGVGRPSIREALFALRRMGLTELKNGERARVIAPTPSVLVGELSGVVRHLLAAPDGMRHFQQARAIFESALAEHAARHASAADIAQLQHALRANQEAVDDTRLFVETDIVFHLAIARIPRNPVFTALHAGISEWLADQRWTGLRIEGSETVAVAAHERIFKAIAAHDAIAAGEAMRDHLEQVEKYYWSAREVSRAARRRVNSRERKQQNVDE